MCEPTLWMLALSTTQSMMANQTEGEVAAATGKAANNAFGNDIMLQNIKDQEITDQANGEVTQRAKEALVERSRLETIAGEKNLTGTSINRIVNQVDVVSGNDLTKINSNLGSKRRASRTDRLAAKSRYQSRRNSIRKPSMAKTGLQIAGHVAKYNDDTPKSKTKGKD